MLDKDNKDRRQKSGSNFVTIFLEINKFDQYVDKVCAPPQGDSSGSIGMQETCHEV